MSLLSDTHHLACVLFSPRSAEVPLIHLDLAVSMCLHSKKGCGRLWQFSDFVKKDDPGDDLSGALD